MVYSLQAKCCVIFTNNEKAAKGTNPGFLCCNNFCSGEADTVQCQSPSAYVTQIALHLHAVLKLLKYLSMGAA